MVDQILNQVYDYQKNNLILNLYKIFLENLYVDNYIEYDQDKFLYFDIDLMDIENPENNHFVFENLV
jgi:hypothetical protein